MSGPRVLVIRLGSMGDVIHALPAVASLKHSLPHSSITWMIDPKWSVLLEGNPYVDSALFFDRRVFAGFRHAWRQLRRPGFDFVVDFQGLIKSGVIASAARAERIFGFNWAAAREPAASWFYSNRVPIRGYHAVERNLDLAAAAGAHSLLHTFPLPEGHPEGNLPTGPFVLACPVAGWGAKQWPLEYYEALAERLLSEFGTQLVINGPSAISIRGAHTHVSGIPGLIHATRKASAIVGIDSGPLHLAAAMEKPGVAIYGPTEPARHGPFGGTIAVLRSPTASTTYKRTSEPHASMRAISPEQVFEALEQVLEPHVKADKRT